MSRGLASEIGMTGAETLTFDHSLTWASVYLGMHVSPRVE
jgi:hypothetical protein